MVNSIQGLKRTRALDEAITRYDEERNAEYMGDPCADPALAWEEFLTVLQNQLSTTNEQELK